MLPPYEAPPQVKDVVPRGGGVKIKPRLCIEALRRSEGSCICVSDLSFKLDGVIRACTYLVRLGGGLGLVASREGIDFRYGAG